MRLGLIMNLMYNLHVHLLLQESVSVKVFNVSTSFGVQRIG